MLVKSITDETLLGQYRGGDRDSFELLVRRHGQELFHFLYRLMGSAAAAEDIVQETFLQVHVSAECFDVTRRFRPWLFTIAANKARDYLRGRRRRTEMPLDAVPDRVDPEGASFAGRVHARASVPILELEAEERSFQVRRLVEQLPRHLREVLVLGYYHGFAYKDMAVILDVPLGTVKSRLHAAVSAMARLHGIGREAADARPAQER